MRIRIEPSCARGSVEVPFSKSLAHRLLIAAALSDGVSTLRGIPNGEDISATLDCLHAWGIRTEMSSSACLVFGRGLMCPPSSPLPCRESGSTLRFLLPLALLSGKPVRFLGSEGLLKRPMTVYRELCSERGLDFSADARSLTVCGPLSGGDFPVKGDVSSQFVTGLLFALPLLPSDSRILPEPPVESAAYIRLTQAVLERFGVRTVPDGDGILVPGNQTFTPSDVQNERDFSQAAFFEAFNVLSGAVRLVGMNDDSRQGDRVAREFLRALDRGTPTLCLSDCPDLAPILFAVAGIRHGAVFLGTHRLRFKESDRISAMAEELRKCGIRVTVSPDSDRVVICPDQCHRPEQTLNGHGDHRIVMALSVLLTRLGGEIDGAEAVCKSYPAFFRDLAHLGLSVTIPPVGGSA